MLSAMVVEFNAGNDVSAQIRALADLIMTLTTPEDLQAAFHLDRDEMKRHKDVVQWHQYISQ